MQRQDVVIIGAGGHAVSVIDILLESKEYRPVYALDKEPLSNREIYGVPVRDEKYLGIIQRGDIKKVFVAIGDNFIRKKVTENLKKRGFEFINAISPYAYISKHTALGCGIAVMPQVSIIAGTFIGDGTIINTNSSIDHDCVVGSFCHVAPGATLCGSCVVGDESFICAGAKIIQRINIGKKCIVGAGSLVIRDVDDGQKVIGIPSRLL
jgi:UDP-perosamine 4-acetyltransferase